MNMMLSSDNAGDNFLATVGSSTGQGWRLELLYPEPLEIEASAHRVHRDLSS